MRLIKEVNITFLNNSKKTISRYNPGIGVEWSIREEHTSDLFVFHVEATNQERESSYKHVIPASNVLSVDYSYIQVKLGIKR
jgi:hypothetical protein